jgi:hypothetical protein
MEKGRILTGARARFSINGVKVGYARSVNLGEETEYQPIEVLDNIEVEEFAPVAYRVSFTAGLFRILGDTLKSRGWYAAVGTNTEEHLKNILTLGELSAQIEDTKTNTVWATVEQVKVASQNWTIDARGIVGKDVTFNAIRMRDESGG